MTTRRTFLKSSLATSTALAAPLSLARSSHAAATNFHAPYLKATVDAGKHVFCEKPHALDVPAVSVPHTASKATAASILPCFISTTWRFTTRNFYSFPRPVSAA